VVKVLDILRKVGLGRKFRNALRVLGSIITSKKLK